MKEFLADIHMHTLASGHAYGTIREMAQAAALRNLSMIGISEHAPGIAGTVDPTYYLNLEVIPRKLFGVEVYHGCEINVLDGGKLSLEERYIRYLDYAIVGIHTMCYDASDVRKNTDDLIACMAHPKIKLVSHPDDSHTPVDYTRLVPAAKELGVALEVNNSSLRPNASRLNARENYRVMLPLCRKLEVPVIVDSDAHDPSAVGVLCYAKKLLEELDFPEELVLSTDPDKLKAFLELPKN